MSSTKLGLNYTQIGYDQYGNIVAWIVNNKHIIDEPFKKPEEVFELVDTLYRLNQEAYIKISLNGITFQ